MPVNRAMRRRSLDADQRGRGRFVEYCDLRWVEDGVLSTENLEEIFLAFVGTGNFVPSRKLLAALAETAGRSEEELREQYRRVARSISGTRADPFEE
jgi:hypothetical protein